jgi:hypothetical protein
MRCSAPAASTASWSRSTCKPERRDPPGRLLRLAAEMGCLFSIDTDAHAPGQLDWLENGCVRAENTVRAGPGDQHLAPPGSWPPAPPKFP